jgi:hypothetical protein
LQIAAADTEDDADDVHRTVAGKEEDRVGNVFGLP